MVAVEVHGEFLEAKKSGKSVVCAGELEKRSASTAMVGEQYPSIRAKSVFSISFLCLLRPGKLCDEGVHKQATLFHVMIS